MQIRIMFLIQIRHTLQIYALIQESHINDDFENLSSIIYLFYIINYTTDTKKIKIKCLKDPNCLNYNNLQVAEFLYY